MKDTDCQARMAELRDRLLLMGGKVETAIANSVCALTERDSSLADAVRAGDKEINRLEVEIDQAAISLLEQHRLEGPQLRFVTTALKIVVDLERMGDLASHVAWRAIDLNGAAQLMPYVDLQKLADLSQGQLKLALDAFVESDAAKADEVIRQDALVDALHAKILNELVAFMLEDARHVRRCTSLMFVVKHLERLGDHATNIAEMVIYMVRGTDIRHPRSRTLPEAEHR